MMNLTHWRLLVAVADTGNFTQAAGRVGITQSGASQAVAQIESSLGVKIFTRDRRHVSLTAIGESVVCHARAMAQHLDAIRGLAREGAAVANGRIRIATFPSIASKLLLPLTRDFQRRHPNLDLVVLEGTDIEVEQWIGSDAIDIGVVLDGAPGRDGTLIGTDAWLAIVRTDHPLARRSAETGVELHELQHEPFILATGGCRQHASELMGRAGLTLTDVRVTIQDWNSACLLVKEGLGISVIPASTMPEDMRGLRAMPIRPAVHRTFNITASNAGRASLPAMEFLRFAGSRGESA